MLETLLTFDQTVFLFLNGFHNPFFDGIMWWGTRTLTWLPLYLVLLWLVIRHYRWQTVWILMFVILMILVSDQLSDIFKAWIARPRPSQEPGLAGIHIVNGYKGGMYGFYSAHASNNLALAIFIILILREYYRYIPVAMICYALFLSYTRIYLGVHYPGDILAGWLAGGLIGWAAGSSCLRFLHHNPGNQSK